MKIFLAINFVNGISWNIFRWIWWKITLPPWELFPSLFFFIKLNITGDNLICELHKYKSNHILRQFYELLTWKSYLLVCFKTTLWCCFSKWDLTYSKVFCKQQNQSNFCQVDWWKILSVSLKTYFVLIFCKL